MPLKPLPLSKTAVAIGDADDRQRPGVMLGSLRIKLLFLSNFLAKLATHPHFGY